VRVSHIIGICACITYNRDNAFNYLIKGFKNLKQNAAATNTKERSVLHYPTLPKFHSLRTDSSTEYCLLLFYRVYLSIYIYWCLKHFNYSVYVFSDIVISSVLSQSVMWAVIDYSTIGTA
jgi:hypothetical protein